MVNRRQGPSISDRQRWGSDSNKYRPINPASAVDDTGGSGG